MNTSWKRRRSSARSLIGAAGNDMPMGNSERPATVDASRLITACLNFFQKYWKASSLCAEVRPPKKPGPPINKQSAKKIALFNSTPVPHPPSGQERADHFQSSQLRRGKQGFDRCTAKVPRRSSREIKNCFATLCYQNFCAGKMRARVFSKLFSQILTLHLSYLGLTLWLQTADYLLSPKLRSAT